MKKEKHTAFWVALILMILVLILGVVLLAVAIVQGPNPVFASMPVTL